MLERCYGIALPAPEEGEDPSRPPTAIELLSAHARKRKFQISDCSA